MEQPTQPDLTLGQYLEQARQEAGRSIRQLATESGVHRSSIDRLLRDEVEEPSPDTLSRIASALELNAADLFVLAGLPIPKKLPSVDVMLRTEYGLSDEGLAEAKRHIEAIAERERQNSSRRGRRQSSSQITK
jgi:transcriptional regulator with XRE-family HTH domain